jgi:hypothetical protein
LTGAAILTLLAAGRPAAAGTLSLATGLDVSSGKYGEALPTTIVSPSLAIKYLESEWAIGAAVPYLDTNGPSNVVPGLGASGSSPLPPRVVTREGIGNVAIWARRTILTLDPTGTSIELKGKIRFGTASAAQGLGTGQNDYAASLELDQPLARGASLFASFGRRFPASTPDLALHPVGFGSVGADYKLAPRWTAALWLDMQQATTTTSGCEAEVTADLTYRISPNWKIDVYGVKGFAVGSPAIGWQASSSPGSTGSDPTPWVRRPPPAPGGLLSDVGSDRCAAGGLPDGEFA